MVGLSRGATTGVVGVAVAHVFLNLEIFMLFLRGGFSFGNSKLFFADFDVCWDWV